MIDTYAIRLRWKADGSKRDERGKGLFAASEARAAGWGGVAARGDEPGYRPARPGHLPRSPHARGWTGGPSIVGRGEMAIPTRAGMNRCFWDDVDSRDLAT